ncbi:hypothetical protein [Brevundimonas lutea]|uniref:hypothetical protein n=1 Tax=Brevundimonas lutea TaxID=2293980 RepID=UPI00196A686D|nr:hypothetical protein [Brevundimonas lutea]
MTVFEITPAPYPGAALSNFGFYAAIAVALISIPLVVILAGIPLLLLSLWVMWLHHTNRKRIAREIAARRPSTVTVSNDGIAAHGSRFALTEVRDIQVGHAHTGPAVSQVIDVSTAGAQLGHNARLQVEAAQHHVSFQVLARLVSDSRLRLVAAGLTQQTATAFAEDLRIEVARRDKAASP